MMPATARAWDLVIEIEFLAPLPDVDDLAIALHFGPKSRQMYNLSIVR